MCTEPRFAAPPDPRLVELAGRHLRSSPIELEVKKMAPNASGQMRKIPEDARTEPGWALARYGDGGWWPAVERALRDGAAEDELLAGLVEMLRTARVEPEWVTPVPSVRTGALLEGLAASLAAALDVPVLSLLARAAERPPQSEMDNAFQQASNVRGAFRVIETPPAGVGLLVDDRRSSGWTLAMVGGQLRNAGAEKIVPIALVTAF